MKAEYCLSHSEYEGRNKNPFRVCPSCNHTFNHRSSLVESSNKLMQDLGSERVWTFEEATMIWVCPHCFESLWNGLGDRDGQEHKTSMD